MSDLIFLIKNSDRKKYFLVQHFFYYRDIDNNT